MGGRRLARDIRHMLVERGDPEYQRAWESALGPGPPPAWRPDVIARATFPDEVREAVTFARTHDLTVTPAAGGHGPYGSAGPAADGGMLLDLSRLRRHNVRDGSATLEPGVTGHELTCALAAREHAFPVARCGSVALNGFLLGGGIGWNSRAWGPACAGLEAIEAVTADGETVRCTDEENADLLWAARGAGPGFFAAVTSFRLGLRHLPPAIMTTRYVFPLSEVEGVAGWADELASAVPANVELSVALTTADRGEDGRGSPGPRVVVVTATAFSCAWSDAIRCLEPLRHCPYAARALIRQVDQPTPFAVLFAGSAALWPEGRRAVTDALWVDDGFGAILPVIARHIARAPSAESLVLAVPAPGGPARAPVPDMAFAPLGRIHLGCYALWADPTADEANLTWLRAMAAAAEPLAAGRYVAEADLATGAGRARRSFTPTAWKRLQSLRAQYDPDGLFAAYPHG